MGDYVNHTDSEQHIDFKCDYLSGLFLDIKWTILETSDKNSRSSIVSSNSILGLTLSEGNQTFSEAQVQEMISKAAQLEDQNKDLESQVELVLSAKKNLEKLLKDEKKITQDLKKQMEEMATPKEEENTAADTQDL
jgi:hypothetical protein